MMLTLICDWLQVEYNFVCFQFCQEKGGILAEPRSNQTNLAIKQMINDNNFNGKDYWIGKFWKIFSYKSLYNITLIINYFYKKNSSYQLSFALAS